MRYVTDKSKEVHMYKCTNCGNEFDGKFCPECGTKRVEQLICPDCGTQATAGVRFCSECGHAFAQPVKPAQATDAQPHFAQQQPAPSANDEPIVRNAPTAQAESGATATSAQSDNMQKGATPAVLKKIYAALRFAPMAMFALYSVLLLLFYLAPIAEVPLLSLMGGGGSESAGSVYSMLDGLVGISVTLIIFAAAAIAYAIVATVCTFRADKRDREIKLFGKLNMTLGEAISAFSIIAYLIFVILAGVAMGQVSSINDDALGGMGDMGGMGISLTVVESGAAPKLVMAFAIIFMVFAAAAVVVRIILGKKFPELWQAESSARAEREAKRKEAAEQAAASAAAAMPTGGAIAADGIQKTKSAATIESGVKPLLHYAYANKKAQRAVLYAFLCLQLTMIAVIVFLILTICYVCTVISPHWIILTGACCMALSVLLSFVIPVKKWSPESFRDVVSKKTKHNKGKLNIKKFVFMYITLIYLTGALVVFRLVFGVLLRGYLVADIFGIVACAALLVAANAVAKRNHAISEYLFGQQGPPPGAELVVEYDEEIQRAAYENYKAAVKAKRAKKDSPDVKKKTVKRRVKFGVAGALLVAVSVFAIVTPPLLTDRFSASYVSELKGSVVEADWSLRWMMGDPAVVRNIGEDSAVIEYYSDNYLELMKEAYEIEKQIENAEANGDLSKLQSLYVKMQSLEARLKTMTFQSLSVYINKEVYFYDDNGSSNSELNSYNIFDGGDFSFYDAKVIGIELDNNRCLSSLDGRKNVKEVHCDGAQLVRYGAPIAAGAYTEVFYTDGSYRYMPLEGSAFIGVDTSRLGAQSVKVQDDWGEYTISVNVVSSVSGTTEFNGRKVDYTLTAKESDNGLRLALTNYKEDYDYRGSIENSQWYANASQITELHFDASIDSYFVTDRIDMSIFTSLRDITVASNSNYLRAENGILYNMSDNRILYAVGEALRGSTRENAVIGEAEQRYEVYMSDEYFDEYWISFTPQESGRYSFFSDSNYVYAAGALYVGDDTTPVIEDNEYGDRYDFSMEYNLTAGTTYYLRTSRVGYEGLCAVSINRIGDIENGYSRDNPVIASVGSKYNVTFDSSGDEFWISFTPESSDTYVIQSKGNLDTHAALYEGDGTSSVETDDDSGESNNFLISRRLTAGTTYYIKVMPYDSSGMCTVHIDVAT